MDERATGRRLLLRFRRIPCKKSSSEGGAWAEDQTPGQERAVLRGPMGVPGPGPGEVIPQKGGISGFFEERGKNLLVGVNTFKDLLLIVF